MPRPPFTRMPGDRPLPLTQRNELTKAFNPPTANTGLLQQQNVVIEKGSGSGGGGTGGTLAGDVTGALGANLLSRIQGIPLSIAPAAQPGQAYVLIGGLWVPSFLGGDVNGSLVANVIDALQGLILNLGTPTIDQYIGWDGTQFRLITRVVEEVIGGTSGGAINGTNVNYSLAHDPLVPNKVRLWADSARLPRTATQFGWSCSSLGAIVMNNALQSDVTMLTADYEY